MGGGGLGTAILRAYLTHDSREKGAIFPVMFCNSCGAECSSSALFCGQCGHQINEAVEQISKKVDEGGASVALTFKQFKTHKEEDRKGYFRNKPRPAKKAKLAH